jgi:hypothetical protein
MTPSLISSYCRSHDITLLEGLNLIANAIRQASDTKSSVIPVEEEGEIGFVAQTTMGETREINLKPSLLKKASAKLASLVQRHQSSKEIDLLQDKKRQREIVKGVIDDRSANGWFINLPNIRAFMPIKEAIEGEVKLGLYANRQSLYFEIVSSSRERNGKPRVILSRRSLFLAKAIAENHFSIYGFVSLKRQAGVKQTIIVRAYPQKHHQTLYQSYFPSERIIYRKMLIDGTIAPYNGRRKETRR